VILVDNASTDDTVDVAKRCWDEYGSPASLKIIPESRQGLSFARVTGIQNASYDVIVFCDDDNWLAPDYIRLAGEIMSGDNKIGICGGVGEAVFENGAAPSWFDKYGLVFGCGPQVAYEGELGIDVMAIYGAGMVVRKVIFDVLSRNNYSFSLTGRKGNKIIAGEDYELCILTRVLGYKLYYSSSLKFRHFMPAQRMQWKYLIKTVYGSALGSAVIFIYADVFRYRLTGLAKYKVNWAKDILKAINSARLIKVDRPKDLQVMWARLSGGLRSVISHIPQYPKLKKKIVDVYDYKDD
jgi:glycosyltransferase involved in cell wall biosynthesis